MKYVRLTCPAHWTEIKNKLKRVKITAARANISLETKSNCHFNRQNRYNLQHWKSQNHLKRNELKNEMNNNSLSSVDEANERWKEIENYNSDVKITLNMIIAWTEYEYTKQNRIMTKTNNEWKWRSLLTTQEPVLYLKHFLRFVLKFLLSVWIETNS